MKVMVFFREWGKFCVDSKNAKKIMEKLLCFWENSVWTCCENFSNLWGEYMRSAVNVLPGSTKILDPTKGDVF